MAAPSRHPAIALSSIALKTSLIQTYVKKEEIRRTEKKEKKEKHEKEKEEGQEAPYNWLTPDRPPLAAFTGNNNLREVGVPSRNILHVRGRGSKYRIRVTERHRCPDGQGVS